MAFTVFVDGQEGTTGLRIHEYLAARRDVEVLRIDADKRKDAAERARLLNAADVAFLCLPDAAAREAAALVTNPRTCLIDASTAHRTLQGWVYGLPELAAGPARRAARRPSASRTPVAMRAAFILLLRPLVDAGLVPAGFPVTATSITGYSGGGKKMIEQYQARRLTRRWHAPRPYGLTLKHKHHARDGGAHGLTGKRRCSLPVVGNFYKGLAVTVPLHRGRAGPGHRRGVHARAGGALRRRAFREGDAAVATRTHAGA